MGIGNLDIIERFQLKFYKKKTHFKLKEIDTVIHDLRRVKFKLFYMAMAVVRNLTYF